MLNMPADKPNGVHHGYQDEGRNCKRSGSRIKGYGPRLHTEDSRGESNGVEDLEIRRVSRMIKYWYNRDIQ